MICNKKIYVCKLQSIFRNLSNGNKTLLCTHKSELFITVLWRQVTKKNLRSITERIVNYRPQQKIHQQEGIVNFRQQQGKMDTAFPTWNQLPLQLSQWETLIVLNSCFSPVVFHSETTPPNFPLLLHKIMSLCFVGLAYGFFCSLLVLNCNSLLFPNKLIFY